MARFEIINGLCEIPFGTTEIKDYEFSGCKNLVKVSIPNSVKSIGNMAFGGTNLESVYILMDFPNVVSNIHHFDSTL